MHERREVLGLSSIPHSDVNVETSLATWNDRIGTTTVANIRARKTDLRRRIIQETRPTYRSVNYNKASACDSTFNSAKKRYTTTNNIYILCLIEKEILGCASWFFLECVGFLIKARPSYSTSIASEHLSGPTLARVWFLGL